MNTSVLLQWSPRLARQIAIVVLALVLVSCEDVPQNQLISAVLENDLPRVEALLNNPNVDINWNGRGAGTSVLTSAAAHDRLGIVELLLRRGADPNVGTEENATPLQAAAFFGHIEVVKVLIDAGANVNAAETRYGMTPLARAARNGHIEVIKLLLDAGADRDARIKDGRDAMQLAQHYGHMEAANFLLSYRASAVEPTRHGSVGRLRLERKTFHQ